MNRREFLSVLGLSIGMTAGCVSTADENDDQSGFHIPAVTVTAINATPPNPVVSLDVRWNARAQYGVSTDDNFFVTVADDGEKFLVVRLVLTNTASQAVDLSPLFFQVEVDETIYEYQSWGTQRNLEGVTLHPDASFTGWLAFEIPHAPTTANLIVNQAATATQTAVTFTHDSSLSLDVLERDNPQA